MRSTRISLSALAAIVTALAFCAGAARPASAQESCSQYNQCYCNACCEFLYSVNETCGGGGTCDGTQCAAGSYGMDTLKVASTVCFNCCGNPLPDYNQIIGECYFASPMKQKPVAVARLAEPALVYVRDCQGNYTLAQIGGRSYGT